MIPSKEEQKEQEEEPAKVNEKVDFKKVTSIIVKAFSAQSSLRKLVKKPECIDYPGNNYL